ncbi:hypothetical protein ScPMuIL_016458 [Solemya velum]
MIKILILLCVSTCGIYSLTCNCDDGNLTAFCGPPPTCPGNTVLDACGCCVECAKVSGQACGGPWSTFGQCDRGLECYKANSSGSHIGAGGVYRPDREPIGVCLTQRDILVKKRPCLQELKHYLNVTKGHVITTDTTQSSCLPKPSCTPEGWYRIRQCNICTGECWCVQRNGKELSNTRGSIGNVTCTAS